MIFLALVELLFAIQGCKQIVKLAHAFRGAQKQKSTWVQGVVEQRDEFFLQISAQVNQQVATTDQVQPGKGRIFNHALLRKNQHVADAFMDAIGRFARLGDEKAREPLRR